MPNQTTTQYFNMVLAEDKELIRKIGCIKWCDSTQQHSTKFVKVFEKILSAVAQLDSGKMKKQAAKIKNVAAMRNVFVFHTDFNEYLPDQFLLILLHPIQIMILDLFILVPSISRFLQTITLFRIF